MSAFVCASGGAKYISTGRSLPTERRHFIRRKGDEYEGGLVRDERDASRVALLAAKQSHG